MKIDKHFIEFPVIPAPMCGIMDAPFREIIAKFGSPMLYTEMLSSDAMSIENKREYIKNSSRRSFSKDIPFVIQIAGHDPKIMANAAKVCEDLGADILDMNFGCPVKKVINGHAGSALMKDLKKSAEIIEATVNAVKIPVTIKMRMGWDHDSLNAPELAKIAQDIGVKSVTLHGRTRSQLYNGIADWSFGKKVKDAIKIPLIINGDIIDFESLKNAISSSNSDGAMVARGLYGKPWIIAEMMHFLKTGEKIDLRPKNLFDEVIFPHIKLIEEHYKDKAIGFAMKHLYFYSKGIESGANFRAEISKEKTIQEILIKSKIFFS